MSKAVPAFPMESPRPDAGQLCWGRSASRGRVSDHHCHEPWSLGKRLSGRFFSRGAVCLFFAFAFFELKCSLVRANPL